MNATSALAIGVLVAVVSCKKNDPDQAPGKIVDLDTKVTGLSGLTRDDAGVFWAVGESGRSFLRIDPTDFSVTTYAVEGGPPGADLEAVAWLGNGRFVVGTETQEAGRDRDDLIYGDIQAHSLVVRSKEAFGYWPWQMHAPNNRGIEGLCYANGLLVLATELVKEDRGRRWAPVSVFDEETNTWTAHWFALTSKTGKLAAIGCRSVDEGVVALAMERHYGVARLLQFPVPKGTQSTLIEPKIAADLSDLIRPLPNFEGLVWNEDGSVVLLTDNHYRGRTTGPSRLYFVPARVLK